MSPRTIRHCFHLNSRISGISYYLEHDPSNTQLWRRGWRAMGCDGPEGATFRRNGAGAPKVRGRGAHDRTSLGHVESRAARDQRGLCLYTPAVRWNIANPSTRISIGYRHRGGADGEGGRGTRRRPPRPPPRAPPTPLP